MMPSPTGTSEVAAPGPLGTADGLAGREAEAGDDAVGDPAGAELVGGADEAGVPGAELAGVPVSPSAVQAPRMATPPPVSATRPAARSTVRRVVAVGSGSGTWRSDMKPPMAGGFADERGPPSGIVAIRRFRAHSSSRRTYEIGSRFRGVNLSWPLGREASTRSPSGPRSSAWLPSWWPMWHC